MLKGASEKFAQFGHGKLPPARRLSRGDIVIYYCGKEVMGEAAPCQRIVALGEVTDDQAYQVEQAPGFKPFRRNVAYRKTQEADIRPLIDHLEFITNKKSWGMAFRRGFFEITAADFELIAAARKTPGS